MPAPHRRERHLHEGGGANGLAALHSLLETTGTPMVITTASSLLGVAPGNLLRGSFTRAELVREVEVLHSAAWFRSGNAAPAAVGIWRLTR